MSDALFEAERLSAGQGGRLLFEGVSFTLAPGAFLGLSGPSGVGKSTLGQVLAGLHPLSSGALRLGGAPVPRGAVQYLWQSPARAMNPRWKIAQILAEPRGPWADLAGAFGLNPQWLERYPHELSGGELQRVSLLRALAARPRVLVADEITAPLDAIGQAGLWRALRTLSRARGLSVVVISHDEALLQALCPAQRLRLG